jgi:serine/threonine protein kinase
MKALLTQEYDILTPDDTPVVDDKERSIYIFKRDGITKVLKMGNKEARGDTTKYKLLEKEYAIYKQLDTLPPEQRAYFPILYDGGGLDDMFFLLIEYVEGKVLRDYINEHLTSPSPVKILIELAKALEALRSIELVHGDLHTDNILVTQDSIKLIDFERTGKIGDIGGLFTERITLRDNVRGSVSNEFGFLYIMYKLLPTGPVHTFLHQEMWTCDPCDSFYTTAIEKLSTLEQGGGARKRKGKARKTKKTKPKAKGSRRSRVKRN